ncbi:hypothetical protein KFL_000600370 [Klebsormidium nitens]|uniref:Mitochondrial substrate carrier family protein n=1 Tax=Klebsormidium nitens TaxID=105231 RepID=A0A1Y1HQ24_KLENI|nr:hypothetical protein KFL_000600370 [Klebsormidium nitens]|eukprot:GAQ80720.1 hypothetical protein KFL_000600370 [Klebsormidium nitens]
MADRTFVYEATPIKRLNLEEQSPSGKHGAVQRQRSRSEGDTEVLGPRFAANQTVRLPRPSLGERSGRRELPEVTRFLTRSWEAILESDRENKEGLKRISGVVKPRTLRRRSRSLGDADGASLANRWGSLLGGAPSSAKRTPRGRSLSEADSPVLKRNQTFPSFFGRGDESSSRGRRHSTGEWKPGSEGEGLVQGGADLGGKPGSARLTSLKLAAFDDVLPQSESSEENEPGKARRALAKAGAYLKDAATVTVSAGVWSCGDQLLQHLVFHGTGRSVRQQMQLLMAGKVGGRVSVQTRVPLAIGRDMLANAFSIATFDFLSSRGAPQMVASTAGTFSASAVTVPAWHLSYLLQTGAASTPRQAWDLFIESQGIEGLFSGLVPTVVRSIPTSFVMSGTHAALKRLLAKAKKSDQTNLLDVFLLGAAAGFASSVTSLSIDAVSKSVPTLILKRAPASVVALALERAARHVAAQTLSKGILVGIGTTGLSYVVDDVTGKLLQKLEERVVSPPRGRISTDLKSLAVQRALDHSAGATWQHHDGQDGGHGHADARSPFQMPDVDVMGGHHMHRDFAEAHSLARPIAVAA